MKKWMKTIPVLAVGAAALTFGWGLTGARAADTEAELIADNIYIGEVAVGGMTAVEAEEAVNAYVQSLAEETVALSANGNTLTPTVAELGLSEDVDAAVSDAVNYGKTGNLVERYKAQKDLEHESEVLPMVSSDESVDAFMLNLNYYGYSWMNINEIVFKIGDNRCFFTSDQGPINVRQESYSNGIVKEQLLIVLDANSISFMQDFIEHRDEEILVRFSGADSVMDFALTKEIKDATIGLYDRYVMAGGTQPESLQTVTDLHCIKMQVLNREV